MENRDIENGIAFVRNAGLPPIFTAEYNAGAGEKLDTSNYANGDCLHTDILTFSNAFLLPNDSVIEIERIVIQEYSDTALFKPDLRLLLFSDFGDLDDTNIIKNSAFALTSGFTYDMIESVIDIATVEYTDITTKHSILDKTLTQEINIRQQANDYNLYGLLLFNSGTPATFSADVKFKIGIQVKAK